MRQEKINRRKLPRNLTYRQKISRGVHASGLLKRQLAEHGVVVALDPKERAS